MRSIQLHGEPSNLTTDFMVELWERQGGLCFYSGLPMTQPNYGKSRNYTAASIDRLDPARGYLIDNVVWCRWVCNLGKNGLSLDEYVGLCSRVAHLHWKGILASI